MTTLPRRTGLELFAASFSALLVELALIRWLPGQVRVIAYFPNLVLIASFLGLGVGALSRERRSVLGGAGVLGVIVLGLGLGRIAFTSTGVSEHLWLLYYDLPRSAPVVQGVILPIGLVFVAVTLAFVPLGGALAARLQLFQQAGRTLAGYAIDLLGSLAGVMTFLLLAAAGARPLWWFAPALAAGLMTVAASRRLRVLYAIPALAALAAVHFTDTAELYSPYYAIRTENVNDVGISVLTNGSLHQQMLDLRAKPAIPTFPWLDEVRKGYRIPVDSLRKKPQRALVLGAGSGNDVAVLLDAGVPEVHAVEIDPVILQIGRTRHPAHPYADPRVIVHNTDARAFLEHTDLRFDLIVFGTLDSMTRLSALANVRLDNFVYTVESVKAARARLTPDGGLVLMFMVSQWYIRQHLTGILEQSFGTPPHMIIGNYHLFNTLFLSGPGFDHLSSSENPGERAYVSPSMLHSVPDDTWPYLYLERPGLPVFYLQIGGMVLGIALIMVFAVSAPLRQAMLAGKIDGEMMLFGAAFLLLETSFVTEMNLLFGATWRTSAIVFGALLFALLVSTLIAARRRVDARFALAGVIATLALISFLPLRSIAPTGDVARVLFALLMCGVPVACAGFAFAARFATRPAADTAFGWNIVGAVAGGVLELLSMLTGLRALFLIAAFLYLCALWLIVRQARATAAGATA